MVKKTMGGLVIVALLVSLGFVGAAMAQDNETEIMTQPENVGNTICPVTGSVVEEPGKYTVEYNGKVYNLCCPSCKETFLADPEKYAAIADAEVASATGSMAGDEQGLSGDEQGMMSQEQGTMGEGNTTETGDTL
ncbi:MAG: YHS domain-containing protein [Deltaproteobacteria bacterium]